MLLLLPPEGRALWVEDHCWGESDVSSKISGEHIHILNSGPVYSQESEKEDLWPGRRVRESMPEFEGGLLPGP